jgi:DNA repair exonuclease SbcCD ATPase subunit
VLVIKEITTRNFVGHHERSLVFPTTGIVLVTGRNGAGKSSFIEAVAVGFYGHTLRGTTPWREGTPGTVTVVTPDLTVRRGVTKTGSNVLNFTRDGKTVKGDSAAKCQKELEHFIPDIDVWRWSSLLSNTDAASFSLATDAKRKELIEDMLAMPSTDTALKDTRAAIKVLKSRLAEANTKTAVLRERLTNEQRRLKEKLETLERVARNY